MIQEPESDVRTLCCDACAPNVGPGGTVGMPPVPCNKYNRPERPKSASNHPASGAMHPAKATHLH
eukprot:5573898-Amphidinium_carterae.1